MKLQSPSLFFSFLLMFSAEWLHAQMPLTYLVRAPKHITTKPPVLILLHGLGSNEEDLFSFANQLPDQFLVFSLRAPIQLAPSSFAWYQVDFSGAKPSYNLNQETKSRQLLIDFIEKLPSNFSINEKEIYLCGFSQGAIMSYSLGLTRPDLIKGIAAMSGRLLEEIKPKILPAEQLKNLKIFISHGTMDNVLPINYARDAQVYLKPKIQSLKYKEYAAAHQINTEMLSDLINWLN